MTRSCAWEAAVSIAGSSAGFLVAAITDKLSILAPSGP
jgi:hypothetical protein